METVLPTIPANCLTPRAFAALLGRPDTPLILDVRRSQVFAASEYLLPLARRCAPEDMPALVQSLPPQTVIVYCVYGHAVSQGAAAQLLAAGWDARFLLGGVQGGEPGVDGVDLMAEWGAAPVPRIRKRPDLGVAGEGASRWITRSRPKIDRIACPWLIRRFIDRDAQFFYVPKHAVFQEAPRLDAVPFDIPGAALSHEGERCSFDALIKAFDLQLPALTLLANVVRAADTGRLQQAASAAGLLAMSLGMSQLHRGDDHAMLDAMMPVYDALYAWCSAQGAGQVEAVHNRVPA
jgi:rhodanese-related sulfurtransferase